MPCDISRYAVGRIKDEHEHNRDNVKTYDEHGPLTGPSPLGSFLWNWEEEEEDFIQNNTRTRREGEESPLIILQRKA